MGFKIIDVVKETKQIIVCDITGEEITEADIVHRDGNRIVSKKGWEKIPEVLRQRPFLNPLLKALHSRDLLDKFTTGFWVLSVYPQWASLYNCKEYTYNQVYQTEQDVIDDLLGHTHNNQTNKHVFKDGTYLYTTRVITQLERTNVMSNEFFHESELERVVKEKAEYHLTCEHHGCSVGVVAASHAEILSVFDKNGFVLVNGKVYCDKHARG